MPIRNVAKPNEHRKLMFFTATYYINIFGYLNPYTNIKNAPQTTK